jgi:hypothetical protein
MAIIGKVSLIHRLISKLSSEDLEKLEDIINSNDNEPIELSLFNKEYYLKDTHKGVNYVRFYLDPVTNVIIDGILIYIDEDDCGLFAIYGEKVENLSSIAINPVARTYEFLDEGLDIEELRRELYDMLISKVSGDSNASGGSGGSTAGGGTKLYKHTLKKSQILAGEQYYSTVGFIISLDATILTYSNFNNLRASIIKFSSNTGIRNYLCYFSQDNKIYTVATPDFFGSYATTLDTMTTEFDLDIVEEL